MTPATIRVAAVNNLDRAAVEKVAAAASDLDGFEALSEQTLLNLTGTGRGITHLVAERGGDLVGYAQIDWATRSAELVVQPQMRRRGIGGQLLDELFAHASVPVWAHGDLPGARALAAARSLVKVRDLWVMTSPPPENVAAPAARNDLRVRTFEVGRDEQDWLHVNALAFADHPEQGAVTMADLEQRIAQPWFDPKVFFLAEDAVTGQLLGSLWVKIEQTSSGRTGEIYALGVHPQAQGRGLGGLLTAQAMAAFAARNLARIELYVEGANTPAIRTYSRAGFGRERADVQYAQAAGVPVA